MIRTHTRRSALVSVPFHTADTTRTTRSSSAHRGSSSGHFTSSVGSVSWSVGSRRKASSASISRCACTCTVDAVRLWLWWLLRCCPVALLHY
jgi:hypothetical protein